jgi:16S rRNA (cytidine1402-2'-O)-methyltransferase
VNASSAGTLYLVSTPIGNLEDLTHRAARILREAAVIACEDTRQTRKLLSHYGIESPVVSYHEHNEAARTEELLARLERGQSVALVSDAGTPLVSDPGFRVLSAAIGRGFPVCPVPGPSAILAALTGAGLPVDEFYFGGFLPPKRGQRIKALERWKSLGCTLILYEAPHRILDTLADIESLFGSRKVVVARELTKLHEEFIRGAADEVRGILAARPCVKGEITLLIAPAPEIAEDGTPLDAAVGALVAGGMQPMDAMKIVAKRRGLSKREVYAQLRGNHAP